MGFLTRRSGFNRGIDINSDEIVTQPGYWVVPGVVYRIMPGATLCPLSRYELLTTSLQNARSEHGIPISRDTVTFR